MMQPRYFRDQICEELKGASDYLKKAIDTMKDYPEWSIKFKMMSDTEQDHATKLYKMFMEWYTENQDSDSTASYLRDCIMDCFAKEMRNIENYKATYDLMAYDEKKEASTMAASMNKMAKFNTVETDLKGE